MGVDILIGVSSVAEKNRLGLRAGPVRAPRHRAILTLGPYLSASHLNKIFAEPTWGLRFINYFLWELFYPKIR